MTSNGSILLVFPVLVLPGLPVLLRMTRATCTDERSTVLYKKKKSGKIVVIAATMDVFQTQGKKKQRYGKVSFVFS